jgi:hypothetical protein
MTFAQKCTSLFIAGHVLATLALAIPWRQDLDWSEQAALNGVSPRLEQALRIGHTVARPIRPAADLYVSLTKLSQRWAMFSSLRHSNLHARITFVLDDGSRAETRFALVRRQVFPVRQGGAGWLWSAFASSYWTKAIERAITAYRSHLATPGGSLALEERHAHFAKLLPLLSERYEDQWRTAGTLVRAEMWVAAIPMTRPGQQTNALGRAHRQHVITRYSEGWPDIGRPWSDAPLLGTRQTDGDIEWTFVGSYDVAPPMSR